MRKFIELHGKPGQRKITCLKHRLPMERPYKDGAYSRLCRLAAIARDDSRRVRAEIADGCDASGEATICPISGEAIPAGGGVIELDSDGVLLALSYDHTGKLTSAYTL